MGTLLARFIHWLHGQWPAGMVERLPEIAADGGTRIPGVYIVGDLSGVPLLKFALDSGARAVEKIAADLNAKPRDPQRDATGPTANADAPLDLLIIGAGVAGMAAAVEAQRRGLRFEVLEAAEPFATLVNFPVRKPIYTYPSDFTPAGTLQVSADVKEALLDELREQVRAAGIQTRRADAQYISRAGPLLTVQLREGQPLQARRVIIAIGRSGNYRRLGVSGESLEKVSNRLHDPRDFAGKRTLVVGGGDSALETAISLAQADARVTLIHRGGEFTRPKQENTDRLAALRERIDVHMKARLTQITPTHVMLLDAAGGTTQLENDFVFSMIGREPPLDFLRRSGLRILGEMSRGDWLRMGLFFLLCLFLYHWKNDTAGFSLKKLFEAHNWFPFHLRALAESGASAASQVGTLLHTLAISAAEPGFWITLTYSLLVLIFGIRRIRRRRTPYVTAQTLTLMLIQCVPLFLLPEILLPLAGHNGWFERGTPAALADEFFPQVQYGHGREYWRAYGFVLAWPLFVYNVFSWQGQPLWVWLILSLVQTFILIPLVVWRWGKGAYCGWICSCGALAETLGDTQRQKMPHGPKWNRLNLLGQALLAFAFALLILRVLGWAWPGSVFELLFAALFERIPLLNYRWIVDVMLAGAIGVGLYFWFSGRVWCRFACPLAALMHIYARFTQFRILAEKKKCISCNVCTSVCHQGIDVMSFANKGLPMEDPQCVRCSACVQSCPTGVLSFGRIDPRSGRVRATDGLAASRVQIVELRVNGTPPRR